jgi:hypothetical protein
VAGLEVASHPVGVDHEPLHDPGEAVEHVIEREERVRDDHALGRRLRDVALVPERHVLESDHRGRAHHAGEPADALGDLRVPFVGHRRRPLHPFAERLFDLTNLGSCEVPDLGREPLQ